MPLEVINVISVIVYSWSLPTSRFIFPLGLRVASSPRSSEELIRVGH
jgi:hypothetical protein